MQRGVVVGEKTVYDMEAVYINITTVLECAVPPSIIDEFGILRKVKAQLMKNLVIVSTEPCNPDYVIGAAGQLLYHIVWPSDGTVSTIATSMGARLQPYNALPTTVVSDRYGNVSAKDHERERYRCVCWYLQPHSHFTSSQALSVCVPVFTTSLSLHLFPSAIGVCARTYNLTLTSPLPKRYRCVCSYLQPHSHFISSQQRSHNEKQGEQKTSLAPPLHMYSGPQYVDGRCR